MAGIIFSSVALLISLAALGVEIGITSWNIRRANRYKRRKLAAERDRKLLEEDYRKVSRRLDFLDEYASEGLWLINFLYGRYNKFADLETELQEGLANVPDDTPIGDADDRYGELKKASKLIRAFMKSLACMRKEGEANSVILRSDMIREGLFYMSAAEPAPEFSDFGFGEDAGSEREKSSCPDAPETEGTAF
jgi:hypothetical protein